MGKIIRKFLCKINRKFPSTGQMFGGGAKTKQIKKNPSNILFRNINEFNIKLILIVGVIFIMLSGYTSYALFSDTIISNNIISLKIGKKNYEKTFSYTGNCEEYTVPYNGYYKIEAWGAQGGGTGEYEGGKGGYTSGVIRLLKGETLSICVGETGNTTDTNHTIFNNGSSTLLYTYNTSSGYLYGGGGATDIRLVGGTWNNDTGLNSRIMVAAGGGGGSAYYSINKGGAGGGLVGLNGTIGGSNGVIATGASQITSGTNGDSTITNTFGVNTDTSTSGHIVTKGGTGYYTGGNGAHADSTVGSGAGGSSFISGYAGVNAITSSTNRTHTNNTIHYSNKYFIQGETKSGVNFGNGKAKITYVSSAKPERINKALDGVRYIKDCVNGNSINDYSHWVELQAIYNGGNVALNKELTLSSSILTNNETNTTTSETINDGDITSSHYTDLGTGNQCVIVDLGQAYDLDEVAVWHYWKGGRTYNDNYTYVSSDNSNWTLVIDKQEPETSEGKRVNAYEIPNIVHRFSYTGVCEEYTVPYNGYYKIEAWGAEGGTPNTTYSKGGKGGYTSGITKLIKGETLYICVGGKGSVTSGEASKTAPGGFNGGGIGYNSGFTERYAGSGGGATDIRLTSGVWNDETGLNSRIMVAAGGGGGWWCTSDYYGCGGSGGGLVGLNGSGSMGGSATTSNGATQNTIIFGMGSDGTTTSERPGAGSGYYGGTNYWGNSSGGSSFISGYAGVNAITSSTDRTHTNNTLHYSNKYFIQGETKTGVRSGDGKAIITLLGSEPSRANKALDGVRYIKDCTTGSAQDNYGKSWEEIQAIKNGVNVALGKPVTGTGTIYTDSSGNWSYELLTDGNIDNSNKTDALTRDTGNQCITVDLGDTYDLDEIAVWHFWNLNWTYNDNYTYVSSDNTNWTLVIDKQEPETSEGKRVNAYEGASLIIEQSKGGTITCTNNTTNQTSTTSLTVSEGDSITCKVNLSTNYELTSLKIEDTSIKDNTAFTYAYKGNTRVKATYYCNDTTGPTITISNDSNGNWTDPPVKMTITATDPSGVSSIYYRYDSDSTSAVRNDWDSATGVTNGIQVKGTWTAARDNYVYIVATDNLGNTSTSTTRVRISNPSCYYTGIYSTTVLNCRSGKGTGYSIKHQFGSYEYVMFTYDSSGWYYNSTYGCYSDSYYLGYHGPSC